jgi:PKD domain-containing protein
VRDVHRCRLGEPRAPDATRGWRRRRARPLAAAAVLSLTCACGDSPGSASAPGPVLVGRADREVGPAPLLVCFDATASGGADGRPPRLTWDFGDGSARSDGPSPCHAYTEPGSYAASVESSDPRAISVVIVTATGP